MNLTGGPTKLARAVTVGGLGLAIALGALPGCSEPPVEQREALESQHQAATGSNGFRVNGFRVNGFRVNGFRVNGFRVNGFRVNGFRVNGFRVNGLTANSDFSSWFHNDDGGDREFHAEFMKYLVGCALGPDQSTAYTDNFGVTYSWQGGLGLAPSWLEPGVSTEAEKQLVTACLMAHVNSAYPEPKHVMISLRGDAPSLATPANELSTLATYDGTYFGDWFAETPKRYLCRPVGTPPSNYVQTLLRDWGRQCYFTADGCSGFFEMVDCATACGPAPAGSGYLYGPSCTVEGKTYKAINLYIPKFKRAAEMTRFGATTLASCTDCLDNRMLTKMSGLISGAKITGLATHAGHYMLEVRHSNSTTAHLKVQVGGLVIPSGLLDRWEFPPTGANVWATRQIPVYLPAGATVTLSGAGTLAPNIDAVSIRFQ